ncbi:MAG: acyl-CoA synthetase [Mycetocola sp.]
MTVTTHAHTAPGRPAAVMGSTGETVTFAELDSRSRRLAANLRRRGLDPGDHVAVLLENRLEYFDVAWATQRSGLYLTPVNWHLAPIEAGYIVADCGARALITSAEFAGLIEQIGPSARGADVRLSVDGPFGDFEAYDDLVATDPDVDPEPETEGAWMFYSSGTTGRPKGIKPPLSGAPFGTSTPLEALLGGLYGFGADTVYLCPAPLYHAAPLGWTTTTQRLGGTVVVMDHFDAIEALRLIERYRATHVQFVPTHFVRMLKLPREERERYDLSSLRVVVHAAAPCPPDVKRQMLEWFGPIIHEYYSGSEGTAFFAIGPQEWLAHPGSVGKALIGTPHVFDDDGVEVPIGETGQIWFETATRFEYHNDPVKTAAAFNDRDMSTLGDIGHLDADGYLYLTDRVGNMIISGGVNIYPREIEDILIGHGSIEDVAVIGVADAEMGESVKAFVQLVAGETPGPDLEADIIAYCRHRLSSFKCPRSVVFVDTLPRLPTGKLLKRSLIDSNAP